MRLSINFFIYLALIIFYCCSEDNDLLGSRKKNDRKDESTKNVYKIDVGKDKINFHESHPKKKIQIPKKKNSAELLIEYYQSSEKLGKLKEKQRDIQRIHDKTILLSDIQKIIHSEIKQIPKSQKTIIKKVISDLKSQHMMNIPAQSKTSPKEEEIQPGQKKKSVSEIPQKEIDLRENISEESLKEENQEEKEKPKGSKMKYLIMAYNKIKSINWKKKKSQENYKSSIDLTERTNSIELENQNQEEKETIEGISDQNLPTEEKQEEKEIKKKKFSAILSSLKPKKFKGFSITKKKDVSKNGIQHHYYNASMVLTDKEASRILVEV